MMSDELNYCWTRSDYRGPYTKKWWQGQQVVAEAVDSGSLYMSDDQRQAIVKQWRAVSGEKWRLVE